MSNARNLANLLGTKTKVKDVDVDGTELILDSDGDSSIQASTDDIVVLKTNSNTALNIDANGHITKPLQTAFSVTKSGAQNNMPVNSDTAITFDTERFDQNADFASNTFTAPVTGRYQLNANVNMSFLDTDATFVIIYINTSNKKYLSFIDPRQFNGDLGAITINHSVVADMDANDTSTVSFLQSGGSNILSIGGGTGDVGTQFSGYLVC